MTESYKVRPSQSPWPRVMGPAVGNRQGEAFTEVQPGGVWSSESSFVVADLIRIWGRQ